MRCKDTERNISNTTTGNRFGCGCIGPSMHHLSAQECCLHAEPTTKIPKTFLIFSQLAAALSHWPNKPRKHWLVDVMTVCNMRLLSKRAVRRFLIKRGKIPIFFLLSSRYRSSRSVSTLRQLWRVASKDLAVPIIGIRSRGRPQDIQDGCLCPRIPPNCHAAVE